MEKVIRYKSIDGSLWESEEKAIERDKLCYLKKQYDGNAYRGKNKNWVEFTCLLEWLKKREPAVKQILESIE